MADLRHLKWHLDGTGRHFHTMDEKGETFWILRSSVPGNEDPDVCEVLIEFIKVLATFDPARRAVVLEAFVANLAAGA